MGVNTTRATIKRARVLGPVVTVLSCSALGKSILLLTDPFADLRLGMSIGLAVAVVATEFTAVVAAVKFPIPWAWGTSFALLLVFLTIGGFSLILGHDECACFGITLPRWVPLLTVGASLGWLLFHKPELRAFREEAGAGLKALQHVAFTIAGGVAALYCFMAVQAWARVTPVTAEVRIEDSSSGHQTGFCRVRNVGEIDTRIVGVQKSCTCIVADSTFSIEIPAGGEAGFPFSIHRTVAGPYRQRILMYLSHPQQASVSADIVGFTNPLPKAEEE